MIDDRPGQSDIEFDPTTGRLRLTADRFAQLVEHSTSGAEHPAELAAAGVFSAQGPHPLLEPGLATARAPVCRVLLEVAGAAGSHLHRGWVNADAGAFLLYTREDRYDFLTTGPTFVPAAIARLMRVGPRPVPAGNPLASTTALTEALFDEESRTRRNAFTELAAADEDGTRFDRTTRDGWMAARTVLAWTGHDGHPTGRDLTIIQTEAGTLLAQCPDPALPEAVTWTPIRSSDLWRAIVVLLPDDSELGHRFDSATSPFV